MLGRLVGRVQLCQDSLLFTEQATKHTSARLNVLVSLLERRDATAALGKGPAVRVRLAAQE